MFELIQMVLADSWRPFWTTIQDSKYVFRKYAQHSGVPRFDPQDHQGVHFLVEVLRRTAAVENHLRGDNSGRCRSVRSYHLETQAVETEVDFYNYTAIVVQHGVHVPRKQNEGAFVVQLEHYLREHM